MVIEIKNFIFSNGLYSFILSTAFLKQKYKLIKYVKKKDKHQVPAICWWCGNLCRAAQMFRLAKPVPDDIEGHGEECELNWGFCHLSYITILTLFLCNWTVWLISKHLTGSPWAPSSCLLYVIPLTARMPLTNSSQCRLYRIGHAFPLTLTDYVKIL